MRTGGARRIVSGGAAALALAGSLAACGGDTQTSVTDPSVTVSGAGRSYDFPATVLRADYPNACRLLPGDSVQKLLGAPAPATRVVSGCSWSTGSAVLPTLQVSWIELGSDAAKVYRQARVTVAEPVSGLDRSRAYRVNGGKTARVDVLQPRAYFRVQVSTTATATHTIVEAQDIAHDVARLVAKQVS